MRSDFFAPKFGIFFLLIKLIFIGNYTNLSRLIFIKEWKK